MAIIVLQLLALFVVHTAFRNMHVRNARLHHVSIFLTLPPSSLQMFAARQAAAGLFSPTKSRHIPYFFLSYKLTYIGSPFFLFPLPPISPTSNTNPFFLP
jgi:hypothetical protein